RADVRGLRDHGRLRLGAGAGPRRADPAVDRRGDARAHRGRLRDQGASDAARRTGAGGTSFEAMTSTRGTRTWPRLGTTVTPWASVARLVPSASRIDAPGGEGSPATAARSSTPPATPLA